MLAELVDAVVGVDTHRDTHEAEIALPTGTPIDLVRDLAVPIPAIIIGRMMGSPDEEMHTLLDWTQKIQEGMTYNRDVTPTFMQMGEYFMRWVNDSRIPHVENVPSPSGSPRSAGAS